MEAAAAIFPPEFLEDPYPFYAQLRETAPVVFVEPLNAWLFTSYDAVKHACTDEGFRVNFADYQVNRMGPDVINEKYFLSAQESMVCNDPPNHTQMRKVFARGFTARRVKEMPAFIERFANECLDRAMANGDGNSFDVIPDYARRVPLGVLSHILGVPEEDWAKMEKWVGDYSSVLEVFPMSQDQMQLANEATEGLDNYFMDMIAKRRAEPKDDYVTECLIENDAMGDEALTDAQLTSNLSLVYFGGHDTQEKMFTNFLHTLDNHPDALAWLTEDISRVDQAMPELMRFDTVGQFMGRCPREDMEYAGFTLKAGQTMMVSFGAANRDPKMFPNPDVLDFNRPANPAPHITFGAGRHRCIGAALAQQNLPRMLKVFLERCPDFRIKRDEARRHVSFAVRGFDSLPIEWGN